MKSQDIEITKLDPEHKGFIEQAAEILFEGFGVHFPDSWPDLESAFAEVQRALDPNRIVRIAINNEEKVLGWIGAIPEYGGKAWNIHPLVVHPGHQNQGVGRALVAALEEILRERNVNTLFFGTDDIDMQTSLGGADLYPNVLEHLQNIKNVNRHSFGFYQKVGFVVVGVIPDANGFGKPDILMAKRISR